MIDLHYAPTPNGWKISIMLEELGLPYQVIPINIRAGEQFRPEFLAISPNNRIPAIVDRAPSDGCEPVSVFETGAILIPRRQDRALSAEGNAGAIPRHGMADVADEWAGAHARPARPFRALCGGEDPVRDRALPRRGGAALPRARYATRQDRRLCRRRLFDRRHRLLSLDHDPQGAGLYARRLPERQALVRRGARAAAGAGGIGDRQVREGAVRRGGAAEYVRRPRQGDETLIPHGEEARQRRLEP